LYIVSEREIHAEYRAQWNYFAGNNELRNAKVIDGSYDGLRIRCIDPDLMRAERERPVDFEISVDGLPMSIFSRTALFFTKQPMEATFLVVFLILLLIMLCILISYKCKRKRRDSKTFIKSPPPLSLQKSPNPIELTPTLRVNYNGEQECLDRRYEEMYYETPSPPEVVQREPNYHNQIPNLNLKRRDSIEIPHYGSKSELALNNNIVIDGGGGGVEDDGGEDGDKIRELSGHILTQQYSKVNMKLPEFNKQQQQQMKSNPEYKNVYNNVNYNNNSNMDNKSDLTIDEHRFPDSFNAQTRKRESYAMAIKHPAQVDRINSGIKSAKGRNLSRTTSSEAQSNNNHNDNHAVDILNNNSSHHYPPSFQQNHLGITFVDDPQHPTIPYMENSPFPPINVSKRNQELKQKI